MHLRGRSTALALAILCGASVAVAAPVATPAFDPDGSSAHAPLKVHVRCATPEASVHVTRDGQEPTPRDPEVDPDSFVLVDEPLVLKAKAWLPDGSASATKTATFALQPLPGNAVSFVEQIIPSLMAVGSTAKVAVTVRNIGMLSWTGNACSLAPHRARDAQTWSINALPLPKPTPTWEDVTFLSKVTAPPAPGTYSLRFRMALNGRPFGEATPPVRVIVLPADEYEREVRQRRELGAGEEPPRPSGSPPQSERSPDRPPSLDKQTAAALAQAKSQSDPTVGAELDRLVAELHRSPRSFRYLRSRGFRQSDAEFDKLLNAHGALFRQVRIIRRDDQGQRVIPGWPGMALRR